MSDSKEGIELEKLYRVSGHPTFAVMTASGDVVDWWVGYKDPATFAASTVAALADPTTLDQKFVRLAFSPTAKDAAMLGRIKAGRGMRAEALALYTRALAMDPQGAYHRPIFEQTVSLQARPNSGVTLDDVRRTADAAIAAPSATPDDKVGVAMGMQRAAERAKDMKLMAPYLTAALEATKDGGSSDLAEARKQLLLSEALHVKGDLAAATVLKRQAMPEGWMTNASALNEFAWWCFENKVNLAEADTLARKAIELSPAGAERAQILDTLAEICNARERCSEAVDLMRQAVKEDPTEAHYKEQLERFEKIVASKS